MALNCYICGDRLLNAGEAVGTTRCGHVYHEGCLSLWQTRSLRCPICWQTLTAGQERRLFFSVNSKCGPPDDVSAHQRDPTEDKEGSSAGSADDRSVSDAQLLEDNASFKEELAKLLSRSAYLERELEISKGIRSQLSLECALLREQAQLWSAKEGDVASELCRIRARNRVLEARLPERESGFDCLTENCTMCIGVFDLRKRASEPMEAFSTDGADDTTAPPYKKRRLDIASPSCNWN